MYFLYSIIHHTSLEITLVSTAFVQQTVPYAAYPVMAALSLEQS
jgi:hypothetical protein